MKPTRKGRRPCWAHFRGSLVRRAYSGQGEEEGPQRGEIREGLVFWSLVKEADSGEDRRTSKKAEDETWGIFLPEEAALFGDGLCLGRGWPNRWA